MQALRVGNNHPNLDELRDEELGATLRDNIIKTSHCSSLLQFTVTVGIIQRVYHRVADK